MKRSDSKYFNTAEKMDKAFLQILQKKDLEYITVTEICKSRGVNRSTFYLHYENMGDLLRESAEYFINKFVEHMQESPADFINNINTLPKEELYLVTPKYFKPYLEYIRENKKLFYALLKKSSYMDFHSAYNSLFKYVISPIMARFDIPPTRRKYVSDFYVNGITAVILRWIEEDCKESIEYIISVIAICMPKI